MAPGLREAIAANFPAASGSGAAPTTQRTDVRDAESQSGWVKALLPSVFDQPDADPVHAQFDR